MKGFAKFFILNLCGGPSCVCEMESLSKVTCSKFTYFKAKNKGMRAIFQNKGKERAKKGKIFENLGKNKQNLKIF